MARIDPPEVLKAQVLNGDRILCGPSSDIRVLFDNLGLTPIFPAMFYG